jgi:hypothetical protein
MFARFGVACSSGAFFRAKFRRRVAVLPVPLVMESATDEEETNTMKKALVLLAFLTALFPLSALAQV